MPGLITQACIKWENPSGQRHTSPLSSATRMAPAILCEESSTEHASCTVSLGLAERHSADWDISPEASPMVGRSMTFAQGSILHSSQSVGKGHLGHWAYAWECISLSTGAGTIAIQPKLHFGTRRRDAANNRVGRGLCSNRWDVPNHRGGYSSQSAAWPEQT